jgi:hypothetical protein
MVTILPMPEAPPIVRSGSNLFMALPLPRNPVYLPPSCVKCGAPATGKPVEKNFYWHHPAIYLVILISPLVYVIVAFAVRKTVRVAVPLCAEHARKRGICVTLAWVLPLVGVADAFILPRFNVDPALIAAVAVLLVLSGAVIWAVVSNPIRPRSIDAFRAEFSGFCEVFLEQFPTAPRMY